MFGEVSATFSPYAWRVDCVASTLTNQLMAPYLVSTNHEIAGSNPAGHVGETKLSKCKRALRGARHTFAAWLHNGTSIRWLQSANSARDRRLVLLASAETR